MELDLKARLEVVMAHMRWERADLVREAGVSSSLVSQWLGKGSKPVLVITKLEAAERLEQRTGFRAIWIAKGIGPQRVADSGKSADFDSSSGDAPAWPFERIDPSTWWSLDAELRRRIEAMIEGAIAVNPTVQPTPTNSAAMRNLAEKIAEGVDAVTGNNQFAKFVQVVFAEPGASGAGPEASQPRT